MAESLCCPRKTITTLSISCISKQNKNSEKTTINAGVEVEKRETLYTVGGESKMVPLLWETVWRFLKKLNIEVPYDLEILC